MNRLLLFVAFGIQYLFFSVGAVFLFFENRLIWIVAVTLGYVLPHLIPGDEGLPKDVQLEALENRPIIVKFLFTISVVIIGVTVIGEKIQPKLGFEMPINLLGAYLIFVSATAFSDCFVVGNLLAYDRGQRYDLSLAACDGSEESAQGDLESVLYESGSEIQDEESVIEGGFFSKIDTKGNAIATIRNASAGFYAVALMQAGVGYFMAPILLIDSVLYTILATALLMFKSRVAAVLLLLLGTIALMMTTLKMTGVIAEGGSNVFIVFFVLWTAIRAVEATVKLHGRFAE